MSPTEEKMNLESKIVELQEQGKTNMENLIKELSSSMRAMNNRTLSTWDITSKNQSIKAHIKSVESMAKRLNWSDEETAHELMLSLRGEAKNIADSLPSKTQADLEKLKAELLSLLYTEKPKSQILDEFYNYNWRPEKQSIPQYAAILRNKLRKMNDDGKTPENDIFLRSRLLQGIKNRYPEFGEKLELMDLDNKDINDLASFAQRKFDVYRLNNDIREENFAALIADKDTNKKTETSAKIEQKRKSTNSETQQYPKSHQRQRHYEDQRVAWEDVGDSTMSPDRSYGHNDRRFRQGFTRFWDDQKYSDIRTSRDRYYPRGRSFHQDYPPMKGNQSYQRGFQTGPEIRPNLPDTRQDYDRYNYRGQSNGPRYAQKWYDGQYQRPEYEHYAPQNTRGRDYRRPQMPHTGSHPYKKNIDRGTTIRRNDRVEYLKEKDQKN